MSEEADATIARLTRELAKANRELAVALARIRYWRDRALGVKDISNDPV
jgi:hypothetical protein